MDDVKLIVEVEKYRELYDPQHPFYKDNSKKDQCWDAVATAIGSTLEECKRRWKQLRDSYVKNKNKTVPSGSAGGSQKDWKYSNIMSFLLPHLQPRSSISTLRLVDLSDDTSADLICEEDNLTAGPSALPSRPGTPATPTLRSTSSSPHSTDVGPRSTTPTQQLSELPRSATPLECRPCHQGLTLIPHNLAEKKAGDPQLQGL
ncbi:hypothetical protein ABVT39_027951 [Epinephelus coioides]